MRQGLHDWESQRRGDMIYDQHSNRVARAIMIITRPLLSGIEFYVCTPVAWVFWHLCIAIVDGILNVSLSIDDYLGTSAMVSKFRESTREPFHRMTALHLHYCVMHEAAHSLHVTMLGCILYGVLEKIENTIVQARVSLTRSRPPPEPSERANWTHTRFWHIPERDSQQMAIIGIMWKMVKIIIKLGHLPVKNVIGCLLACHENCRCDKHARDIWEDTGIHDSQVVYAPHPELGIQHCEGVVVTTNGARARRVMAPGIIFNVCRQLLVCLDIFAGALLNKVRTTKHVVFVVIF